MKEQWNKNKMDEATKKYKEVVKKKEDAKLRKLALKGQVHNLILTIYYWNVNKYFSFVILFLWVILYKIQCWILTSILFFKIGKFLKIAEQGFSERWRNNGGIKAAKWAKYKFFLKPLKDSAKNPQAGFSKSIVKVFNE